MALAGVRAPPSVVVLLFNEETIDVGSQREDGRAAPDTTYYPGDSNRVLVWYLQLVQHLPAGPTTHCKDSTFFLESTS